VIDLHADATVAIPYTIVDRPVALRGAAADEMAMQLWRLAESTGLTVLMEYAPAEYVRYGLDRSLAGAMVNTARVPALTLEVGPRGAVSSDAVEVAVQSVWGVLASLGLVDEQPEPHSTRVLGQWRRAPVPRVKVSGVFAPSIAPGQPFAAGDELGTVRSVDGAIREKVTAPAIGVVVSWVDNAWVEPRAVVGTLGLEQQ
jgi:predicted deacylase